MPYPVVDFHSHILPGIDDGADHSSTGLEMLRRMKASGVGLTVATPHYYERHGSVERFLERRAVSVDHLRRKIAEESAESAVPELRLGAEVAFAFGIEDWDDIGSLCIEGTKTLLLELPFGAWTDYEYNAVSILSIDRGFDVVLAHFERFLPLQGASSIPDRLLSLPVTAQVNAESLLPLFSRGKIVDLFRRGNAKLLGSDAHNLTNRAPNLAEGRDILRKKLGDGVLEAVDRTSAALLHL